MKKEMGMTVGYSGSGFDKDLAGHFKMKYYGPRGIEKKKDKLAFTPNFPYD
jgi:hypothetical protein